MSTAEIVYVGRTLVYATDEEGVDHTTDAQFQRYMTMRLRIPGRVIIYDGRHDMEAALKQKGLMV